MAVKQQDYVFQMKNEPEEMRNFILEHYALLILSYELNGPLNETTLAHYIVLDCAIYPQEIAAYEGNKKIISNTGVFEKTYFDYAYVLSKDEKIAKEYTFAKVNEILEGFIPQKLIDKDRVIQLIERIIPRKDPNLIMCWHIDMQNRAKEMHEFKKRLQLALESNELKEMPEPIQGINTWHITELLDMYALEAICPNCGWEMAKNSGISILAGGEEHINTYLQCDNCSKYFVETYCDRFCEENSNSLTELNPEIAKRNIEEIKKCPNPHNKLCNCDVHIKYFKSKS